MFHLNKITETLDVKNIQFLFLEKGINWCQESSNSKCFPISPIPMANETTIVNKNSLLRALGWGAYDNSGAQSRFLRQVDLRFNSTEERNCRCPAYYELRTMVGTTGQDTCKGDSGKKRGLENFSSCSSGGPLITEEADGSFTRVNDSCGVHINFGAIVDFKLEV